MTEQLKEILRHNVVVFDFIKNHKEKIRELKTNLRAPCPYCIHDGFACEGCARMKFQNFEEAE